MNIKQTTSKIVERIRQQLPDFEVRDSQLQFMDAISEICGNKDAPNHIIAELPTGTGKSLGSLIPALAYITEANATRSKDDSITLCYSTATIALQKQLTKDIDLLQKAGVKLTSHIVVGRARFICKRSALSLIRPDCEQVNLLAPAITQSEADTEIGLSTPENIAISEVEKTKVRKALTLLKEEKWSGIVDDLPRELTMEDKTWRRARADANTCNRQCQYWGSGCPFVKNRMDTESADVIITNHAMVFADLEKSHILPAPERTLHILDEAHHLVENFHGTMERSLHFGSVYEICSRYAGALAQGMGMAADIADLPDESNDVNQRLVIIKNELLRLMSFLDERYHQFAETLPTSERDKAVWRLEHGFLKQSGVLDGMGTIYDDIIVVRQKLASVIEGVSDKELNVDEAQVVSNLGMHYASIEKACDLLYMYLDGSDDNALWYKRHGAKGSASATLFGAKINVADDMRQLFWERAHKSVSMSATLSNDGHFSAFNHESGLMPPFASQYRFSSPFEEAFQYSTLHLYPDFPEPDWRNETAHSLTIVQELTHYMSYHKAGLQLFVSKRQMNEVVDHLPKPLREVTLVQGVDGSRPQIIAAHRERIDKGEVSLLIGLASFSEGLDLKQQYLTFVGIAKLAFGSFNEPRKMTESEKLQANGGNPFMSLTLPVAEIALQQSVGRLIRSMECRGEIAIFDKRLLTKRYGAGLLNRLPPFYREYHTAHQRCG